MTNITPLPAFTLKVETPNSLDHKKIIDALLETSLQKAVIARKTTLTFNIAPKLLTLLKNLLAIKTNAHLFCLMISPDEAFFGCTPEILFQKENQTLYTEALAGTMPLKAKKKLFNPKELKEFLITRQSLIKTLSTFSKNIEFDPKIQTKTTANLVHLHTKIKAECKSHMSCQALIRALHPTSAMGGWPKHDALDFIYNAECFDRGLFASPFSLTLEKQTDCLVAIRSALLKKNQLHIFAGSGCVKDSKPSNEWQELNEKIAPFLCQFGFTNVHN